MLVMSQNRKMNNDNTGSSTLYRVLSKNTLRQIVFSLFKTSEVLFTQLTKNRLNVQFQAQIEILSCLLHISDYKVVPQILTKTITFRFTYTHINKACFWNRYFELQKEALGGCHMHQGHHRKWVSTVCHTASTSSGNLSKV